MEALKARIQKDGIAVSDTVLIVDSFINHQMDPEMMDAMGKEFARYFEAHGITKVVTIESSGIPPAIYTAMYLGVQLLTLKKQASKVLKEGIIQTAVHSFTKGLNYELTLSKKYLAPTDKVLIIDDFLANGEAVLGAIRLIEQCEAKVAGVGIVIEKSFQIGRGKLEAGGYDIYSLARLKSLAPDNIKFL